MIRLAYLFPGDIRDILGSAGFADVRLFGGFSGEAVSSDQDELVVRARAR